MQSELAERFNLLNKRVDDNKLFITTIVMASAAIFGVLALIFTWNLNSEKSDLRDFKKDIRNELDRYLGKIENRPNIELLTRAGIPLAGQMIYVKNSVTIKGLNFLRIPIVLKNSGNSQSGVLTVKVYTKEPLKQSSNQASTDEPTFRYEAMWQGKRTALPDMPGGGFTHGYPFQLFLESEAPPGVYPVLFKIYYGNDRYSKAQLSISVGP